MQANALSHLLGGLQINIDWFTTHGEELVAQTSEDSPVRKARQVRPKDKEERSQDLQLASIEQNMEILVLWGGNLFPKRWGILALQRVSFRPKGK